MRIVCFCHGAIRRAYVPLKGLVTDGDDTPAGPVGLLRRLSIQESDHPVEGRGLPGVQEFVAGDQGIPKFHENQVLQSVGRPTQTMAADMDFGQRILYGVECREQTVLGVGKQPAEEIFAKQKNVGILLLGSGSIEFFPHYRTPCPFDTEEKIEDAHMKLKRRYEAGFHIPKQAHRNAGLFRCHLAPFRGDFPAYADSGYFDRIHY